MWKDDVVKGLKKTQPLATFQASRKLLDSGYIALGDGRHGPLSPSIVVSDPLGLLEIGPCFIGDDTGQASPVPAEVRLLLLSRPGGLDELTFTLSLGSEVMGRLAEVSGEPGRNGMVGLKFCRTTKTGTLVSMSQST